MPLLLDLDAQRHHAHRRPCGWHKTASRSYSCTCRETIDVMCACNIYCASWTTGSEKNVCSSSAIVPLPSPDVESVEHRPVRFCACLLAGRPPIQCRPFLKRNGGAMGGHMGLCCLPVVLATAHSICVRLARHWGGLSRCTAAGFREHHIASWRSCSQICQMHKYSIDDSIDKL